MKEHLHGSNICTSMLWEIIWKWLRNSRKKQKRNHTRPFWTLMIWTVLILLNRKFCPWKLHVFFDISIKRLCVIEMTWRINELNNLQEVTNYRPISVTNGFFFNIWKNIYMAQISAHRENKFWTHCNLVLDHDTLIYSIEFVRKVIDSKEIVHAAIRSLKSFSFNISKTTTKALFNCFPTKCNVTQIKCGKKWRLTSHSAWSTPI